MSRYGWRWALASVAGSSHDKAGSACQDAGACRVLTTADDKPVLVAVVSDGAGSAPRSGEGATLACATVIAFVTCFLNERCEVCCFSQAFAEALLAAVQAAIVQYATAEGLTARDFACTLLVAIAGESGALFVQAGDGAIVVARREAPDEYGWVFWPQRGEYENETRFVTDAGAPFDFLSLACDDPAESIDAVALFTDGMQRLALEYSSHSAHKPFFAPLFARVLPVPEGHSTPLSAALAAFLGSAAVNARTDDDKTLILAMRRPDEGALLLGNCSGA